MKVIILEDIKKLGRKYEIKEVKDGYAKNFLIPRKMAKPATSKAIQWAETQKELRKQKLEQELQKLQEIASKMDGFEIMFPVKVGEKGELFQSINAQKIAEKLKESGFKIKKDQVELKDPIKDIGEFPVKIKFEHNLETEIRVIVNKEK